VARLAVLPFSDVCWNIDFSAPSRFGGIVAILLQVPSAVKEGVMLFSKIL
jgi:hypothetical protein